MTVWPTARFDPCFNPAVDQAPPLDGKTLTTYAKSDFESWLPPNLLLEFTAHDGVTSRCRDCHSAAPALHL